jgi:hypothetical protein
MKATLIVIGVGRASVLDYVSENTFYLSRLAVGHPDAVVLDVSDHHSKIIINFTCDSAVDAVKGLILLYPHLRFVLYYEGDGVRGTLQGRKGIVTKEVLRDDRPAWIRGEAE